MIRLLTESDRNMAIDFLAQAAEYNLYPLGNLESVPFPSELCQFWGDFDEEVGREGNLRAILNRYMNGWVVYGMEESDWAGLGQIVDQHSMTQIRLQDNPGGIHSFLPHLYTYEPTTVSVQNLVSLDHDRFAAYTSTHSLDDTIVVRRATMADRATLIEFYKDAGHMSRSEPSIDQPLKRTRIWIAEQENRVLSASLTNAETSQLAMIGGVYTLPGARNRGLNQAVTQALCHELLRDDKQPVLYWETSAAGAVYRKLGFQAIGKWRSLRLQKKSLTSDEPANQPSS